MKRLLGMVQVQDAIKAALQELLSGERVGTVRMALAMAAAAVARIAVPSGQWPGLLSWLQACTSSPGEAQRETALMLICSLIDTIGACCHQKAPCTHVLGAPDMPLVAPMMQNFPLGCWQAAAVVYSV